MTTAPSTVQNSGYHESFFDGRGGGYYDDDGAYDNGLRYAYDDCDGYAYDQSDSRGHGYACPGHLGWSY